MSQGVKSLSPFMTVVGMVNGMIGGLILILPLMALKTGYILTFFLIVISGFFSFLSCYLCVLHLNTESDLDSTLLMHFNGNRFIRVSYDFLVWANLFLIDILYFSLIVIQWQNLLSPYGSSTANPLINLFILLALVLILRHFDLGAQLMAYGIISIVVYVVFLAWVMASAPSGPNQPVAIGTQPHSLASALGQAFSIQSFFIPVLKRNPHQSNYVWYVVVTYLIGILTYLYIAYMGSFGILNRIASPNPTTIEDYFGTDAWEVKMLQIIYLIHLYSVFPQFLITSKRRFFSLFTRNQNTTINVQQVLYFFIMIFICGVITVFKVNITYIIQFNGSFISFFFIYLIPIMLHIKCLYFSKAKIVNFIEYPQNKERTLIKSQIEIQRVNPIAQEQNKTDRPIKSEEGIELHKHLVNQKIILVKCKQILSWILLVSMGLLGLALMITGLIFLAQK